MDFHEHSSEVLSDEFVFRSVDQRIQAGIEKYEKHRRAVDIGIVLDDFHHI